MLTNSEIFDAGQLGDGDCGGHLDLDTYVAWVAPNDDLIRYNLIVSHEGGHWARWNGTTTGVALTLMRYASHRAIRDALGSLPEHEARLLRDARAAGQRIFQLGGPPPVDNSDLANYWQIWTDLHVAYSAIYDWSRLTAVQWDISEAIGSALSDVLYWAYPLFDVRRDGHRVFLGSQKPRYIQVAGEALTSRVLFEAVGLCDELMTWATTDDSIARAHQATHSRYGQSLKSSYGVPLRALEAMLGKRSLPPVSAAVTVAVLADFALNPAIPPFVSNRKLEWNDIYPPIRYIRACDAVKQLGLLSAEPSASDLRSYSSSLSSITGLPDPFDYRDGVLTAAIRSREDTFAFRGSEIAPSDHDSIDGDYVAFLAWVQRQFWSLRLEEPTFLLLYGQNVLPDGQSHKIEYMFGSKGDGWYRPPFLRLPEEGIGFSGDAAAGIAGQYLMSTGLYLSLHHFACKLDDFDVSRHLPSFMSHRHWASVREAARSLMNVDFWK